ncbi:hypothetical protein Tco_0506118 [Tanacetum coccineum]
MSQDSKSKAHNSGSSKSLKPKPIQKIQLKCELCNYTNHLTDDCYRILYCMICKKEDHRTSDDEMYTASLKRSENYMAQLYQYASPSKQILKAKAKPFLPCTHYGFNNHRPDDYRNYPECDTCGTLYTPPLTIMSLISLKERHIREPIWYLDSRCSRSMTCVKSYLHQYVEQRGLKVVFGDNSSCITKGYGSINYRGIIFTKVAFVNGLKYNLISISQLYDAKYIVQFNDKEGTIFNANKEIGLIAPRRNDVYVLDMSSPTPNGACFFAKALESKFDAKADDGYFLGYSFVSKAFRIFNTRRQQVKETYHVTFNESIEAIRFTNTSVDEIGINDSSRYPPDEFIHKDDPSRQYQSQISNQVSTSSHSFPQNRWSKDQHIKLVNIIGDPGKGMLTRSMAAKLTAASASKCLFVDFLFKIEPKKVFEALKYPGWVDAMQEELN